METKGDYVIVNIPNKGALSELLMRCKGPNRTMAQFADVCGSISTAKLSRILTGKITRNLSVETIRTIYENRDSGAKLSVNDLFRANGMISQEEYVNDQAQPAEFQPDYRYDYVRNIIRNELFDRGYALLERSALHPDVIFRNGKRVGWTKYGLAVMGTRPMYIPELDNLRDWYFIISLHDLPDADEVEGQRSSLLGYGGHMTLEEYNTRNFLNEHSSVFLADAWEPESLEGIKICWVFASEEYYKAFRKLIGDVKLNSAMSTILVDGECSKVIKEEWLNCPQNGNQQSLFDLPVQEA